ncbi:MAG TPA: GNAT family N-acetyltransferase [Ktedonobacteraceae bacterium]|nr:GNAT family N-acetyltransferase [Ktedonobacteraceae bacterium]
MPVQLRPVNDLDHLPRIAELMNMVDREPVNVDKLREWLRNAAADRIYRRVAALDDKGQMVGFHTVLRNSWMRPGHFWTRVIVDIAHRHLGIGTLLLEDAIAFIRTQNATYIESEAWDDCALCLQFAEKHGFSIERHTFESHLDLNIFDESRFKGTVEAVEASGIRFFTLADLGNTLEAQQKLYEINRLCASDDPSNEGWSFPPFEAFRKHVFEASWFRADGQIIAADGDRWVGLAAVGYYEHNNSMHNAFTGVDRAYRGRKVALALKLLAIQCARRYGAKSILTDNDSLNASMLAINRKLGYQQDPGIYRLLRAL